MTRNVAAIRKQASWQVRARLDHASRAAVIKKLAKGASILDVGCGNASVSLIKNFRRDLNCFGIDIIDYCISDIDKRLMEKYVVCSPESFAAQIRAFDREFDLVLSAHNLEHCNHPTDVLAAMMGRVTPGGLLYLAFPSEASVHLPKRGGCLNFYDDPTHRTVPRFERVMNTVREARFELLRALPRNRGNYYIGWMVGALQEPASFLQNRVLSYTWNYWGFESVIIARRTAR